MGAKILIIDHNDSFTYNLAGLFESAGKEVTSVNIWSVEELVENDLQQCLGYDAVVLSPGPGLPEDYPAVKRLLDFLLGVGEGRQRTVQPIPVLGICLGLQTIVRYFGGRLYNLSHIQHGRQVELLLKNEAWTKGPVFDTDTKVKSAPEMEIESQFQVQPPLKPGVNIKENGPAINLFNGLTATIKVGLYHSWGMDSLCAVPELTVLATAQLPAIEKEQQREVVMAVRHQYLPVCGLQFHPESYMTPDGLQIILNWLSYIEAVKSRY